MNRHHHLRDRMRLACGLVAALALGACGNSDDGNPPAPPPGPSTTNVTTTVIDGKIGNALVCVDKNGNGACDSDETQGRTDSSGNATLAVPSDDAGKYALLALVGTDAVDADHGPVTVAYTMQAPADQTAVVSPLSTLVQRVVADSGASTAAAASAMQSALGLSASLFANYQAAGGSADAATVARLLVVTQQQQLQALASAVGTSAIDGQPITATDLQVLVQRKLVEMAQPLAAAAGDPAVAAATGDAKAAAIAAAATQLVTTEGITAAGAPVAVAAGRQAPITPSSTPEASVQLVSLSFTDAQNWSLRALTSSIAQATPDNDNKTHFVDRRVRSVAGNIGTWSSGADPTRNSDVHWNGSAWVTCGMNFESKTTVRTAAGLAQYDYCGGRELGSSQRSTFDVAGQSMATVLQQARDAGYTNLTVTSGALGNTTFPAGSKVYYHASTPTTIAFTYLNGGGEAPAGTSNRVTQYSAAVAGGGTASQQASGEACNSTEANTTNGTNSTTLESMIAVKRGTPCIYNPGTFVYQGVTYGSGDRNEWWGNSTVSLGKLGTAPVGSGTAPGYYTTNTLLRVGFAASGNGVTYYACQERFSNGSTRNCNAIGTGTYAIQTLGDGRVLTFANLPAQSAGLTYERVLVERGGAVFLGFRSKPVVSNSFRLNITATAAFLAQLGLPAIDPAVPFTTTAGSFVGTWDLRGSTEAVGSSTTAITVGANGAVSCFDRGQNQSFACTLTFTDVATGAYTWIAGQSTISGASFDHVAAATSGSYSDPTGTPTSGTFVGTRR